VAVPLEVQGDLVSLSDANAFIIVPEDSQSLKAGDVVDVMVLDRSSN
jgi:molybdopterin biosynthesis enzyme